MEEERRAVFYLDRPFPGSAACMDQYSIQD